MENKTSFWVGIAFSSTAALSAVAGAKLQGFDWLLYVCGITLILSVGFLCWDRFLAEKFLVIKTKRRRNNLLLPALFEYSEIIEKFSLLEKLDSSLGNDKIDWGNRRPHLYGSSGNSLSVINHSFKEFPESYRFISMNVMFTNFVRSYDSWLSACDGMLQSGNARYKTENAKNEILNLVRKYETLMSEHDNFCSSLNKKISNSHLILCVYGQSHSFNWAKAGPENHNA
jgi:hypothetical protein